MRLWKLSAQKGLSLLFLIVLCCTTDLLWAQRQLIFLNPTQGKLIQAKEGDQLSIRYKGYLGQTEYFKSTLTSIDDSSFTLGLPMATGGGLLGGQLEQQLSCKEIKYSDVLEFRRSGMGRTLLKSGLQLGAAIGSLVMLTRLYEENKMNDWAKWGISIGVGLSLRMVINLSMPDKPNHKMKEGWQINPVKE